MTEAERAFEAWWKTSSENMEARDSMKAWTQAAFMQGWKRERVKKEKMVLDLQSDGGCPHLDSAWDRYVEGMPPEIHVRVTVEEIGEEE